VPAGDFLAIELLGPHNTALNTQRPLGPARLKWRLLVARGYRVVVVNTWQWDDLDGPLRLPPRSQQQQQPASTSSFDGADLFSEKLLFLQSKLAGPIAAAVTAATAAAAAEGGSSKASTAGAGTTAVRPEGAVVIRSDGDSGAKIPAVRTKLWSQLQRPVGPPMMPPHPPPTQG